jgi:protein BCP1
VLEKILTDDKKSQVGLILTERLINCPSEVVPPMYNMLLEEITWALEEKEPYEFTHYLVLSKKYAEVASKLDDEISRPSKKSKQSASADTFYFHPEDEVLEEHALVHGGFSYVTKEGDGQADSRRAFQEFGIQPQGSLILIDASKIKGAVEAIEKYISAT